MHITDSDSINNITTRHNVGYDIIRTFAIFMVVAIHSNVAYLNNQRGSVGWLVIMQLTAVCVVAVPLFFMISGALLLDCDKPVPVYVLLRKRLPKQAIPFLIWSIIYTVVRILTGKIPFSLASFTNLFHEPAYYQFWFMYTLLAIYLILPALQAVVCTLSRRQFEYILLIWFVFSVVLTTLQRYISDFAISDHVDLILCEGYVGYFLLGCYLKKYHQIVSGRKALAVAFVGFFATGTAAFVEWKYSVLCGAPYEAYVYGAYLLPGVVITSSGLFLFFQNTKWKNYALCRFFGWGSKLSLGVYYVHMLVLTAVEIVGFQGDNSALITVAKTLVIYVFSVLASIVISQIPHIKTLLMGLKEE